jgi:hypothetical protein
LALAGPQDELSASTTHLHFTFKVGILEMKVQYPLGMNYSKLDEYQSAVEQLRQAVQALTGSPLNWQEALDNYENASSRCEMARTALHDAVPSSARNL